MNRSKLTGLLSVVVLLFAVVLSVSAETARSEQEALTTAKPDIPVDELALMLEPLSSKELFVEADSWLDHVKKAVQAVNLAQIDVKRQARLRKAQEEVQQDQTKKVAAEPKDDSQPETQAEENRLTSIDQITELQDIRTARIDRLNVVLDQINAKIGKTAEGTEKDEVLPYRRYIDAVSGIKVDVSDTQATMKILAGWVASPEGGIRWVKNISLFLVTVLAFWLLARIASKGVSKAISAIEGMSVLLSTFIVKMVRRIIIAIGIIVGLSALEINIGPLLAVIGAAGFVIAFALQDTLSNFASGIMIMFYRPFDVDDAIDVSGVTGKVKSMNLVTTTIMTFDNKMMIVPNNSIWGNIITNSTGSDMRRVDLVFGIGYQDDIAHAERVLAEIVNAHPLVLKQPEPVIRLHELDESSCNFICRPWTQTGDFWTVYWDITRSVKERFDAEGISIPYPQRDIHLIQDQSMTSDQNTVQLGRSPATPSEPQQQAGTDLEQGE